MGIPPTRDAGVRRYLGETSLLRALGSAASIRAIAHLLFPALALAVSDGSYDYERQGCRAEDFTYDRKDEPGHDTPGCETISAQAGPGEANDFVRAGIAHELEGTAPHSGAVRIGPRDRRIVSVEANTGYALTGPRTLSPGTDPTVTKIDEPHVSPAVAPENAPPSVPARPLDWSLYYGMDDNWIFGEHHSTYQGYDPEDPDRDAPLLLGPVSGGGVRADTHPTNEPGENANAADAGLGFCADGYCATAQTEERTVYEGGSETERDRPAYEPSGNPPNGPSEPCHFREPSGKCVEYHESQGRVYAPPGITVYQDPSPAAPARFGPEVFPYPLPSSHAGAEGIRIFDRTLVDLRGDAPAAGAAGAGPIRMYAIGYKHLVDDAESYEAYRAHLNALADAAVAADSSAPADARRVFLFPEDSALFALFIGARGAPFRALEPVFRQGGGNGAAAAIAGLLAAYQVPAAYYRTKFPEQNLSQARIGLLALTDTLYRSFYETFREIAIRHAAWVVTSANLAPAEIITDPARVALLADPEALDRPCATVPAPCAYEATSGSVYNQAFVFDPAGEIVASPFAPAREGPLDGAVKKTYLVPIEQGPLERGRIGLDLAYGDLRQVRPVPIAGVPMGIVISKPAWMLDELGRLEAWDAAVMLQPEAFSSWAAPVEDWSPDVLKQSGWSQAQKHAPFRYSVLAELTGNFFDLVFDAQNHVVRTATAKSPGATRYVGQPDDVGWTEVSDWVASDAPGGACGGGDLRERRECLAAIGRGLAPASGDPRENGYSEPLVFATLDLGPPAVDTTRSGGILGANVALDPAPGRQRNPHAASGPDGSTYVVWQDDRSGVDRVRIARIAADGTVGASVAVAPAASTRQIFPQVAVSPSGAVHVAWQELDPAPRIYRTFSTSFADGFFPLPLPVGVFADVGLFEPVEEQWKPSIAVDRDERLHIAWIGLSDGFERLFYTRVDTTSDGFDEETQRLDDEAFPAPDPLAERLNNRWNPSIAVRHPADAPATVAIAWTDFRSYAWDLFGVVSADGGDSFGPHLRADDAGTALERLHDDPSVAIGADGAVYVAWTDQAGRRAGCPDCARQRRPDADVAFARLAPGAASFATNVRIDDTGDGLEREDRIGFSNQWRPALAVDPSGRLVAVWQDHREGNNDVWLAVSEDGGTTWSENRRVDDTGGGPSNQYAPALSIAADGTTTILWQDDRDGRDQIYLARGVIPD